MIPESFWQRIQIEVSEAKPFRLKSSLSVLFHLLLRFPGLYSAVNYGFRDDVMLLLSHCDHKVRHLALDIADILVLRSGIPINETELALVAECHNDVVYDPAATYQGKLSSLWFYMNCRILVGADTFDSLFNEDTIEILERFVGDTDVHFCRPLADDCREISLSESLPNILPPNVHPVRDLKWTCL
jgi:hypothetical protein